MNALLNNMMLQSFSSKTLPIIYYPNDILNISCEPVQEVNSEIMSLIRDMYVTMHAHKGLGIAAPQVNRSLQIFVIDIPGAMKGLQYADPIVFINPVINVLDEVQVQRQEGCLSFPGVLANTKRYDLIQIKALDFDGNEFQHEYSGFYSTAILHENDHLSGVTIESSLPGIDKNTVFNNVKKINRAKKRK